MRRRLNMHSKTAHLLGIVCIGTMLSASKCYKTETLTPEDENKNGNTCSNVTFQSETEQQSSDFDGVDLLISIDNSGSMAEEQNVLSTGIYTLINQITLPLSPTVDPDWGFPPINNIRVAIVSSDMGLQWGEKFENGVKVGGKTGGNTTEVTHCEGTGRNGAFLGVPDDVTTIEIKSGEIRCEDGGNQCPDGFTCGNNNRCVLPDNESAYGAVNCPETQLYVQSLESNTNFDLATQVACMAQQGTGGCGIEQQLESVARGLENYTTDGASTSFLVETHLLALLVVSDEEDCSIRDKGLFQTEEWLSGASEHLNVACNLPEENNTFLFPADTAEATITSKTHNIPQSSLQTYFNRFVALKGGRQAAVIFGAIVGVPHERDGAPDHTCQGDGLELKNNSCLDHPKMETRVGTFDIEVQGQLQEYKHFLPACQRFDRDGHEITGARPGRRYVKVAQEFGKQGYVHSICNDDWSPALRKMAEIIAGQVTPSCYPEQLPWQPAPTENCPSCGLVKSCDAYVEFVRSGANIADKTCGDMYHGLTPEKVAQLERFNFTTNEYDNDGSLTAKRTNCVIPKIPAPLDCDQARQRIDPYIPGWYYCEKSGEHFYAACHDGINNDDDNGNGISDSEDAIDCADPDCQYCCDESNLQNCEMGCFQLAEITDALKKAASGQNIKIRCGRQDLEQTTCE